MLVLGHFESCAVLCLYECTARAHYENCLLRLLDKIAVDLDVALLKPQNYDSPSAEVFG